MQPIETNGIDLPDNGDESLDAALYDRYGSCLARALAGLYRRGIKYYVRRKELLSEFNPLKGASKNPNSSASQLQAQR
ncbi:MAG TPA: hypothetical protein VF043_07655 [Ktedonobacteraceae bacterium]